MQDRGFLEEVLAAQDERDQGNPFAWVEEDRPVGGLIGRLGRWFATPDGRHRQAADGAS